jgi:hypothetical protein
MRLRAHSTTTPTAAKMTNQKTSGVLLRSIWWVRPTGMIPVVTAPIIP